MTTDRKIRKINKSWRNKDRATDVLSFPQLSVDALRNLPITGKSWTVGDIIISLPRAKAQAKQNGWSLSQELDRLLVHGLLHLLGYDHEKNLREARRMQRLERILLTH